MSLNAKCCFADQFPSLFLTVACGFPPDFNLKTVDGHYWCLEEPREYEAVSSCGSNNRRIYAWGADNPMPKFPPANGFQSNKCILEAHKIAQLDNGNNGKYIFGGATASKRIETSHPYRDEPSASKYQFQAFDAGNGYVNIKNFWDGTADGKWVKRGWANSRGNSEFESTSETLAECGTYCKFYVEVNGNSGGCMIKSI